MPTNNWFSRTCEATLQGFQMFPGSQVEIHTVAHAIEFKGQTSAQRVRLVASPTNCKLGNEHVERTSL